MLFVVNIKKLVISITCSKCGDEDEKILKEKQSIEILKIIGLKVTFATKLFFAIKQPLMYN